MFHKSKPASISTAARIDALSIGCISHVIMSVGRVQ